MFPKNGFTAALDTNMSTPPHCSTVCNKNNILRVNNNILKQHIILHFYSIPKTSVHLIIHLIFMFQQKILTMFMSFSLSSAFPTLQVVPVTCIFLLRKSDTALSTLVCRRLLTTTCAPLWPKASAAASPILKKNQGLCVCYLIILKTFFDVNNSIIVCRLNTYFV